MGSGKLISLILELFLKPLKIPSFGLGMEAKLLLSLSYKYDCHFFPIPSHMLPYPPAAQEITWGFPCRPGTAAGILAPAPLTPPFWSRMLSHTTDVAGKSENPGEAGRGVLYSLWPKQTNEKTLWQQNDNRKKRECDHLRRVTEKESGLTKNSTSRSNSDLTVFVTLTWCWHCIDAVCFQWQLEKCCHSGVSVVLV